MPPRSAFLAAALGAALAGCPKGLSTAPPVPPAPSAQEVFTPQVRKLAEEAQALLRVQDELLWKHWTEGARIDVAKTYEGREGLFSLDSVQKIDALRQLAHTPREIRALTYLQTHFVGEYLSRALAGLNDAIANVEASATFSVGGREYPYRDLERLLANEKSAETRRALYAAATAAVERISLSVRRKEERTAALLKEVGYPSYEAFGAELRQADLTRLGFLADQILEVTHEPYTKVIGELAQSELQLPLEKLTRADMPRLFRPRGVDSFFPEEALAARALATLRGLGIELKSLPNILVDTRALPAKNPRPLCLAVDAPGDVRVSLKLAGGVRDQAAMLHELGHALHFGLSREQRFELARLGNSALGEAYAYLLEDLLEDPIWLESQAGLSGEKLSRYLAASSAYRLYQLRRSAGKLLYELAVRRPPPIAWDEPSPPDGGAQPDGESTPALDSALAEQDGFPPQAGDQQDEKALYGALMSRTYGFPFTPHDEARYLVDRDDFYQSADLFRAWFLAGQLQGQLKARFGPAWWQSRDAGMFLRALWAKGNALSARELARELGDEGIRPDVLLLRLATALRVPIRLPTQLRDPGQEAERANKTRDAAEPERGMRPP